MDENEKIKLKPHYLNKKPELLKEWWVGTILRLGLGAIFGDDEH